MSSRRRRLDPVGPFGNPDGSRADIEDVLSEFVDFGGNPAYGHLATRANDSKVRVIVGKLGAGKTVYLRRLQDFQSHQDSVYADVPQQSLPKTEVIVKACQWFSDSVLVEKWMQIWERAIMRALASHLLRRPELRQQLHDEQADELERSYARLIADSRRPRSIYSEVRDIINEQHTAHQLSAYLDDPLWDDLEDLLGEVIGQCKPVYFYLDAIDEEFSHAPMYWLRCQEGLFYQVMRLLRDHKLGGRLHVVVCIRDIVMSSVYRSEHAPRYYNEPHIRVLTWDRTSLLYLLGQKLQRLPPSLLMRRSASGPPSIRDWLGIDGDWNGPDGDGTIEDYLLHHTRLIPRDIISLGNELSEEVLRQKQAGRDSVPPAAIEAVVQRCAKRFGDSQLAQCANQISSDLMPQGAALHDYSELFTSTQAYISGTQEDVRSFVRMIGVDRFSRGDLEALQEVADLHFERATNLATVLWQNGLLGYVDEAGRRRYYSMGDIEQFHFPPEVDTYVLHPCLVYAVGGIRHVPEGTEGAAIVRHTVPYAPGERSGRSGVAGAASRSPSRLPLASPALLPAVQASGPASGLASGLASGRSQGLPEPDPEEVRSSAGTKPRDYAVGDVIDGRFEILQVVGRGGFSKVYRVRDDVEDAERAIKLFDNAAGYQAVRREIGALRKIQHPNVVKVFWAGKTRDGEWYLITEFLDGESLDEFATGKKSLRDREAVDVALDLLDALVAFHPDAARIKQLDDQRRAGELTGAESRELAELQNSGLVHRDIKPLNVVLTRTGAKLLDFNIASRAGDPVHTQSGTPPYQPPDAGLDRWDVSTDLFAVGVLLYRLLGNGLHPFPHAMPMAGVPVTDPRTIRPDLDRALAGFLVKACAPASADRFATAVEMRAALREIRAGLLPACVSWFSGSGVDHREDPPLVGHALELVGTAVLELQAGPRHQVAHRGADQHLARAGQGRHPGADVHGDAPDRVAGHLDLTGVQARPDLDAERLYAADGGGRAPDGAARTVEHGEEAVTGRVDLAPPETGQLTAHERVVALEQVPPRPVAVLDREPGRPHDVGEQDGGQDPVGFGQRPDTGHELLDLADERVLIARPHELVVAGELHVPGARNVVGHVAPVTGRDRVGPRDQHRRHGDGRQHGPHVEEVDHLGHRYRGARAGGLALVPRLAFDELGVGEQAGGEQAQQHSLAPRAPRPVPYRLELPVVESPRVIIALGEPGIRVHHDQGPHPRGIGRGEDHGHETRRQVGDQHGLLDPAVIHHGAKVVHPFLDGRQF
jgi:protein kinase-like protein